MLSSWVLENLGFNRINSCRSIPTTELTFIPSKAKYKFQSYQFMQINPDLDISQPNTSSLTSVSIVSIHADQSRRQSGSRLANRGNMVSIVSIQADQSRRRCLIKTITSLNGFNRINSGRSIPTASLKSWKCAFLSGFNRINSGRSIPTGIRQTNNNAQNKLVSIVSIQADQSRLLYSSDTFIKLFTFQSYQFRQINPDSGFLF